MFGGYGLLLALSFLGFASWPELFGFDRPLVFLCLPHSADLLACNLALTFLLLEYCFSLACLLLFAALLGLPCTAYPQGQLSAEQTEAFRQHAKAETERLDTARRRAFGYRSTGTVKTHLGSMQTKLSARNRVEIAAWAWERNLVG